MALSDDEVGEMVTPAWAQAKAAIAAGDLDRAVDLIDVAAARVESLQTYSINWITSLLSFIGRRLGEHAVESALRETGEDFVRPRRDSGTPWEALPAEVRAKVIARAMVANGGACEVTEDDDKIVLSFRCGSGGRLIDEGRYDGEDGYLTLRDRGPRTFQREQLPVYCAHCSVNNEIQPVEWGGVPTSVEYPPRAAGEPCVHHVYRDPRSAPDETWLRIGKTPPG